LSQQQEETGSAPLKVLSYNIWWWGNPCPKDTRDYACLTGMHAYWKSLPTMDLVGVQECDGGWATLKSYFDGAADYLVEAPIDGNLCTLYNPVRLELLTSGRQNVGTGSASYRYAAFARVRDKETGETIFFVNTHWDHQRQDPAGHAGNTASMIMEHSLPEDILIVVGDFNQNPDVSVFSDVFENQLGLRREGTGSAMGGIDMIWSNHNGGSTCQSPEDHGSDHNPITCELTTCLDCPPPTTTTTTSPPRTDTCADYDAWPDVDAVTCSGCTALVLTAPYGGRCDRYCESFGHVCIAAAEEQNENCQVSYSNECSEAISGTSDMLCTCEVDRGQGTPVPPPSPSPSSSPSPSPSPSQPIGGSQWYGFGRVTSKAFWKQMRGIGFSPTDTRGSESFMSRSAPVLSRLDDALTKVVDNGFNMIRTWRTHSYEELVLQRISERGLDIKVQLGVDIANDGHARQLIDEAAAVASKYPELILGLSVGNERIVLGGLSADTILEHVRYAKSKYRIPVTYNFVYSAVAYPGGRSQNSGRLCEELDFVNVHLYGGAHSKRYDGAWKPYQQLEEVKREEAAVVAKIGRNKPLIIGETGWQDRGYAASSVENLREYYMAITRHVYAGGSFADSMFYFNLNDESWKGGDDRWGLYEQGDADGIGDTQDHKPKFSPTSVTGILYPSENMYERVSGVGSWGGWCTCPDGQRYKVGDKFDGCANGPSSLACEGGAAGDCEQSDDPERDGMRVMCAAPASTTIMTTQPATSTDVPNTGSFQLVEGGGRACRGSSPQDNLASHYRLESASSLSNCQSKCMATPDCQGIEFNSGISRCEVWTQPIQASWAVAGFDCYVNTASRAPTSQPPNTGSFQLVEGGGRACRGSSPQDNLASHYRLESASSLSNCQSKCMATPDCQGIEFNSGISRCEVWTQPIQASWAVAGFDCYTLSSDPIAGTTVLPTTTTTTSSTSSICYGTFSAVVQEEGAGVGEIITTSLEECQRACSENDRCRSAAFCPVFEGCYMKEKSLTGNEPIRDFYDCQTIYQKPCDGA